MSTIGHGQSKAYYPHMDDSGDQQRNISQSEIDEAAKRTGKNLKGYMPKDQIDAVNRIEREELHTRQAEAMKKDPTLAATLHGNTPHRGAMTDKELMMEDEETIRRMEEKKERKKWREYM
ncbi:hypothetical protein QBC34DRAFT_442457 [Podospora aff. communis PSN243]|uniref:Uncharacterized protein n=1 Tax=Podospora aff. communis PSN243 TaxID=3040156 RepID=A0AAV9G940_9PEZI|nr:hypothetical protein QBC34DRAFT_442457 [Podospora aff. communis PSN243]